MGLLDHVINYIMPDKDRIGLIVKHLKDNPNQSHMLPDILRVHRMKMTDAARKAIWDMVYDGVILWYPDGSIQYNQDWRNLKTQNWDSLLND